MRRCFARVLLLTNLVGEESPRCLTFSADRAKSLLVEQAAEPMGHLNYSESANFNINRLSEGAKRMSLPDQGKRTARAGNYKCPIGVLLAWDGWEKMTNDRVVCHQRSKGVRARFAMPAKYANTMP